MKIIDINTSYWSN